MRAKIKGASLVLRKYAKSNNGKSSNQTKPKNFAYNNYETTAKHSLHIQTSHSTLAILFHIISSKALYSEKGRIKLMIKLANMSICRYWTSYNPKNSEVLWNSF